ncbi:MAG: hypothetical protein LBP89_01380 [Helicobacteraceae bacterium]|nr:hypothetical protein [Helicobacteraceae bacterium]
MKKLTVLAFLAALGLFALGCGESTASGSVVVGGSRSAVGNSGASMEAPNVDPNTGYTTSTTYQDPATGETTNRISDIKSDGTGATPPAAPTFAGAAVPAPAFK